MARLVVALFVVLLSLLSADEARAQPSEDAKRAAVRALGYEGVQLYEQGDYEAALAKLDRAYRAWPVPTLGLWSARTLEKLGRLVEASERYFDVMRLPLPELEREVHEEAQTEARTAREALEPRLVRLTLVVEPADEDVEVTIDGEPVDRLLLDAPIPLDPGEHRVAARRGETQVEERIEGAEGAALQVRLTLPARPVAPPPPAEPAPAPAPAVIPAPETPPGDPGRTQRIIGYTLLGVGGAALAVGAGLGIAGLVKRGQLDCAESGCPPERADEVDAVNALRTPSTVLLVAGAVGAATGVAVWLTAPEGGDGAALLLGPTGAALRVAF